MTEADASDFLVRLRGDPGSWPPHTVSYLGRRANAADLAQQGKKVITQMMDKLGPSGAIEGFEDLDSSSCHMSSSYASDKEVGESIFRTSEAPATTGDSTSIGSVQRKGSNTNSSMMPMKRASNMQSNRVSIAGRKARAQSIRRVSSVRPAEFASIGAAMQRLRR